MIPLLFHCFKPDHPSFFSFSLLILPRSRENFCNDIVKRARKLSWRGPGARLQLVKVLGFYELVIQKILDLLSIRVAFFLSVCVFSLLVRNVFVCLDLQELLHTACHGLKYGHRNAAGKTRLVGLKKTAMRQRKSERAGSSPRRLTCLSLVVRVLICSL